MSFLQSKPGALRQPKSPEASFCCHFYGFLGNAFGPFQLTFKRSLFLNRLKLPSLIGPPIREIQQLMSRLVDDTGGSKTQETEVKNRNLAKSTMTRGDTYVTDRPCHSLFLSFLPESS